MGQKWPKNAVFSKKMCVLILTGPHVTKFGQNGNKMKFLAISEKYKNKLSHYLFVK